MITFLLYKKSFAYTDAQNFSKEKFAHEQIYGKLYYFKFITNKPVSFSKVLLNEGTLTFEIDWAPEIGNKVLDSLKLKD